MLATKLAAMAAGAAAVVAGGAFLAERPDSPPALPDARPTVTLEAARATAQARVPGGKIEEDEFECEDGRLLYTFEISTSAGEIEISIDPFTGEIVDRPQDDDEIEASSSVDQDDVEDEEIEDEDDADDNGGVCVDEHDEDEGD